MIVVVTGGMGSGKSEVCALLNRRYGFPVYEADSRVKQLYDAVPGLIGQVEKIAGRRLRNMEGLFVPSLLAEVIFSDRRVLEGVEALMFPALKNDFAEWVERHKDSPHHIFESATVLEKPQFDGFGDLILLVDAPFTLRLYRACARDGAEREKTRARMQNQPLMNRLSEGASDPRVDHVILNDGSQERLAEKVAEFVEKARLT